MINGISIFIISAFRCAKNTLTHTSFDSFVFYFFIESKFHLFIVYSSLVVKNVQFFLHADDHFL